MHDLLTYHKLKLIHANQVTYLKEEYTDQTLGGWNITDGEWHAITVDSNIDESGGLDGDLAIESIGSYDGGTIEREIELDNYGEILFEHYVQNENLDGINTLKFYVDGVEKLCVEGASPWYRCAPIGVSPGTHTLKFVYDTDGAPNSKKAVIDTFTIRIGKTVPCLITTYQPAKPIRNLASNKVLRGNIQYQQMIKSDTEINFTATFSGLEYHYFMSICEDTFYFVDEFGICYRGIFPEDTEPNMIAMNCVYAVELCMRSCNQIARGFC
ncbi:MAG: hypothetical protein ATN35_02200 [Epulopiscium sp. Nele67-Bin004]|nr:MAG: hypothetical protein ATN35_02200 [Epulopiscium sp. Nele67-Bin004]